MKLVVGLGNPGRRYEQTRHNVGFVTLHLLAGRLGTGHPKTRFAGKYCEAVVGEERVGLLQPETYMNQSGQSVRQVVEFFKLASADVMVVCDDLNLPLAKLRIRPGGSAGGQKGLADIIRTLGTEQVPRLRIGIGSAPPDWDVADYVLSRFAESEQIPMDIAVVQAVEAIESFLTEGIEKCMNRFNRSSSSK